jgi:hypothetical protein
VVQKNNTDDADLDGLQGFFFVKLCAVVSLWFKKTTLMTLIWMDKTDFLCDTLCRCVFVAKKIGTQIVMIFKIKRIFFVKLCAVVHCCSKKQH